MDGLWIHILTIVLFTQKVTMGTPLEKILKQGDEAEIYCRLGDNEKGSMVIWFRLRDDSGWEFIASFSLTGIIKTNGSSWPSFNDRKIKQNKILLKSYNPSRDSGLYGCGSLKGSTLNFGEVTRLISEKAKVVTGAPPQPITEPPLHAATTARACVCKYNDLKGDYNFDTFCSIFILGPLAGGCGLLLLLLIVVIMYCNHIRTRRCPHHHKRRPRMMPAGKPEPNNRRF